MNGRVIDYSEQNNAFDRLMSAGDTEADNPAGIGSTLSGMSEGLTEAETNGGRGRLVIQAVVAGGALPIGGATVTVTNNSGEVIEVQTTDNSGRTPGVVLPAPSAEYSQKPGTVRPYATYNVRIEKPGYYTREFLNVAVFDRIESIQPVIMEPLGEDATESDRVNVVNEQE